MPLIQAHNDARSWVGTYRYWAFDSSGGISQANGFWMVFLSASEADKQLLGHAELACPV